MGGCFAVIEKKKKKKKGARVRASGRRQLLKDSFFFFQKGLMSILLSEGSFECCSLRLPRSFTPARRSVSPSVNHPLERSGRHLSHLTSPHLTPPRRPSTEWRGSGGGRGAERGKERVGSGPASHPPCEDLSLVTRAFKASSRVYPQPHVSLQFD